MKKNCYLVKDARFDIGDMGNRLVSLLGPGVDPKKTHISLIAGPNGTSKSRMIASLVEKLCEINAQRVDEARRRFRSAGTHGLTCSSISILEDGDEFQYPLTQQKSGHVEAIPLPSRVLVLSNLVMDRFHFERESHLSEPFYHYLGIRQATNLTTTGSADRSVTEALLQMVSDADRFASFQSWIDVVFGARLEVAFGFPRLKYREIVKLLNAENREGYVSERLRRRIGNARSASAERIREMTSEIVELFEFLLEKAGSQAKSSNLEKKESDIFLPISTLTQRDRERLTKLVRGFSAASQVGISAWPTFCVKVQNWLSFSEFSSGEQNILSVGAKLVAFARPRCLVAIDEPEVSLNVVWQQHYIELIRRAMLHSPGSHVVIATHSPHLIASLPRGESSVILARKSEKSVSFETYDANFEGWGAESVLYQVLGIPSASSFHLNRDLAEVLRHVQDGGRDKKLISGFLEKVSKLNFGKIEPLGLIVKEIKMYLEAIN